MKKFFLLTTFFHYSLILSMEIIDKETIINYMHNAKQAEKNNNLQEAFQWYGKAASVYLPPSPNYEKLDLSSEDPYIVQRKSKELAYNKIIQKAYDLKKQGKYKEALLIYQCAPQLFANQITSLNMLLYYQSKNQK